MKKPTRSGIYKAAGIFFLVLGVLGIVFPVVPAILFIPIGGWFLARGSNRLYRRILAIPFIDRHFGEHIRAFKETTALSVKAKSGSVAFFWISALVTTIFFSTDTVSRILIITFTILATWYVLSRPTFHENRKSDFIR